MVQQCFVKGRTQGCRVRRCQRSNIWLLSGAVDKLTRLIKVPPMPSRLNPPGSDQKGLQYAGSTGLLADEGLFVTTDGLVEDCAINLSPKAVRRCR